MCATSRRTNAILNNLTGIETIKSFTTETREVDRVERASSATESRIDMPYAWRHFTLIRMAIVVVTATLLVGGWQTLDGHLAVGAYSVLIFMTQRLLWPLTRSAELDLYQRAMASTKRVLDLLDTRVQVVDGPVVRQRRRRAHHIPRHSLLACQSRTGTPRFHSKLMVKPSPYGAHSSATTVIRLLLRFHEAEKGTITLDGPGPVAVDRPASTSGHGQPTPRAVSGHGTDNIATPVPTPANKTSKPPPKRLRPMRLLPHYPMGTKPV